MLERAILESTIFYNFSRIYHQLTQSTVTTVDLDNTFDSTAAAGSSNNNNNNSISQISQQQANQIATKPKMSASLKFKAVLYAIFQPSQPMLIQKSMRHVDAISLNDTDAEYRLKREKNNESVRKSRAKNRVKLQECSMNVNELKHENVQLNKKLESLQSELYTLKGLFQHCFSFNLNNLSIKPSEIPTSTLHKIILQNKPALMQTPPSTPTSSVASSPAAAEMKQEPVETGNGQNKSLVLNEVDNYYVNQIKNALSNMVKPNVNMSPIDK